LRKKQNCRPIQGGEKAQKKKLAQNCRSKEGLEKKRLKNLGGWGNSSMAHSVTEGKGGKRGIRTGGSSKESPTTGGGKSRLKSISGLLRVQAEKQRASRDKLRRARQLTVRKKNARCNLLVVELQPKKRIACPGG